MHVVAAVEGPALDVGWAGCSEGAVEKKGKESVIGRCLAMFRLVLARGWRVGTEIRRPSILNPHQLPAFSGVRASVSVRSGHAHVSHRCRAHSQNPISSDHFKQPGEFSTESCDAEQQWRLSVLRCDKTHQTVNAL